MAQKLTDRTETTAAPSASDLMHLVKGSSSFKIQFGNLLQEYLKETDIDTLAKLNAVLTDATLIDGLATETADTGTTISLANVLGNYCNMASANSNTTFTTTGAVTGGWAKVLINAASEPTVTGATKITGSAFAALSDMYMIVNDNGNRVEYWFAEI